ncbi:MAG: hypothetical protein K6C36_04070 [Clostridia bacterium]|nr:hypothetical protein [Clostridia bacterium]
MAIEKMTLVRASGPLEYLNEYISVACLNRNYSPENAIDYLSDSYGYKRLAETNPYEGMLCQIEELAVFAGHELNRDDPALKRQKKRSLPGGEEFSEYIEGLRSNLEKLYSARKEASDELAAVSERCIQYSHFSKLDVRLGDLRECRFIKVRFGKMQKDAFARLEAYSGHNDFYYTLVEEDAGGCWVVYCAALEKIDEVDGIFASLFFDRMRFEEGADTAAELAQAAKEKSGALQETIDGFDARIAQYWEENDERIMAMYAALLSRYRAFSLRRYAAVRHDVFFFVGWVPFKWLQEFKKKTHKLSFFGSDDFEVTYSDPEALLRATPPTKLRNFRLFRPFEYFVSMYGMPRYGSVDITAFMAISYSLLFGMMFGDLGQGLVVAAAGFFLYKKKGSSLGAILVPCGISSAFFGLIFGSVFGYEELLDPLYRAVGLRGKPISVMDSINSILIYAISIGVVMVTCAMVINIYTCVKTKKYAQAVFSNNGAVGIVFYLTLVSLVLSFMGGPKLLSGAASAVILAICAVLLFAKEILIEIIDEKKKPEINAADFIMQNFFEVIEYVLSYFSNTVSFLRVGAFVLVHAGMMMVIFSLAGSNTNFVVIALGNVLIIVLEGLLSGIQALRLEFYEMFSRCFDGDARPFVSAA